MNNNVTPTNPPHAEGQPPVNSSLKTVATAVYALQVAAFFVGITSIIAVIIAHIKIGDARGSWLESHFRWQIRTFWYSVLWGIVGAILLTVAVGWVVFLVLVVWVIYRIAKGWLRLIDGKAMYTA